MPDEVPEGFCWDYDKAEANLAKHGIAFEDAVAIFDGPTFDVASVTHAELRIASTGIVRGTEITVVYTVRGTDFRIISARRAKRNEREWFRAWVGTLR